MAELPETTTRVPNDPNAAVPLKSCPTWHDWSKNLVHKPARSGEYYYFAPTTREELARIVKQAALCEVQLRASGQRHSQAPLVADDDRADPPYHPRTWLIDLSCYADLGPNGTQQVVVDAPNQKVTVNSGVREDYLAAELAANNLMLKTVTAGGFFSVGGMTAIDVHGATLGEPILAETVSSFSIMGADGKVDVIGTDDDAIRFARVSLGALGIVTSVTLDVAQRRYADTLQSGRETLSFKNPKDFAVRFLPQIDAHNRLEVFFNPYSNEFDILWWDIVPDPPGKVPNPAGNDVASSCTLAQQHAYGSPLEEEWLEKAAKWAEPEIQLSRDPTEAELAVGFALDEIHDMFDAAQQKHGDLWLTQAARSIFMSYFVELSRLDEAGLTRLWQALQVVHDRLRASQEFLLAAPLEFRFIKGGRTALAGTYSDNPDATFVNLDMIGFVDHTSESTYPPRLLDFFAAIEKEWYGTFNGMPHNGKMYGFHDPATGATTEPFSQSFLDDLAKRRGERLKQFARYRQSRDPNGRFCNDFLKSYGIWRP